MCASHRHSEPTLERSLSAPDRLDLRIRRVLGLAGPLVLRAGLGGVFLWFGALKLVPRLSPADDLAGETVEALTSGVVSPRAGVFAVGLLECLIGLGLLSDRFLRSTLLLLAFEMAGTMSPLVLFPKRTFIHLPLVPSLEGQYILKNVVIIGAGMVLGSRAGSGRRGRPTS
jgi:hypothetical protein